MERFTISLDSALAQEFDALIKARGYSNRSEAVRDMLRHQLEADWPLPRLTLDVVQQSKDGTRKYLWRLADGEAIESCTILTTDPNELLQPIHNRMPVILPPCTVTSTA